MVNTTASSLAQNRITVLLKKLFHFFLFSSFYIAICAVIMLHQTEQLFRLQHEQALYYFVFFSTICSYNFHWYLTPGSETERIRSYWTKQHKLLHIILYAIGFLGAAWFGLKLIHHWLAISGAVLLTFLYTAPKIPYQPFIRLRKIAVGKTIFLAFVWMYVTSFLPLVNSGEAFKMQELLFCISRFFLVYSICIMFDYRDRENDRREGIKSMVTWFDEKGVDRLFYISLFIFVISGFMLYYYGFPLLVVVMLIIPGFFVLALYKYAKKNFSDYLYYFILDGLMMCSALFTALLSI